MSSVELSGGEVVEEEERRRALHGDVVDAVVDEVRADGVVDAEFEGDLELGADAVCGGDQDGLREFLEVEGEEAAEAADFGEHMLVEGLAREHLDALLGAVAGGDVDAGVGVGDGLLLDGGVNGCCSSSSCWGAWTALQIGCGERLIRGRWCLGVGEVSSGKVSSVRFLSAETVSLAGSSVLAVTRFAGLSIFPGNGDFRCWAWKGERRAACIL